MATPEEILRTRLDAIPAGIACWHEFENAATDALRHLFVPPLTDPIIQPRTYSGIDRRDAIFPNRNLGASNHWGRLLHELDARMVLVEFKNYDRTAVGKDEVNQTRNYLTKPLGRLALIVSAKKPSRAAHVKRNTVYSEDGKVIVFVVVEHLKEMLYMKERGEDPADWIMDAIERFYIEWELLSQTQQEPAATGRLSGGVGGRGAGRPGRFRGCGRRSRAGACP